mmetsp:Transcript_31265/g.80209  ORF Transcript_31265/g.80209 Transcript_31265/m.80209 type:complete len:301 (-) Transcript_31265:589-1491(-)
MPVLPGTGHTCRCLSSVIASLLATFTMPTAQHILARQCKARSEVYRTITCNNLDHCQHAKPLVPMNEFHDACMWGRAMRWRRGGARRWSRRCPPSPGQSWRCRSAVGRQRGGAGRAADPPPGSTPPPAPPPRATAWAWCPRPRRADALGAAPAPRPPPRPLRPGVQPPRWRPPATACRGKSPPSSRPTRGAARETGTATPVARGTAHAPPAASPPAARGPLGQGGNARSWGEAQCARGRGWRPGARRPFPILPRSGKRGNRGSPRAHATAQTSRGDGTRAAPRSPGANGAPARPRASAGT